MALQNQDRRARLLAMAKDDKDVREELAEDGSSFGEYHPRMEAVHAANAKVGSPWSDKQLLITVTVPGRGTQNWHSALDSVRHASN